jgi:hypothetical protein
MGDWVRYESLAEMLGFNLDAAWTLFWTLFFLRLALGFAVGVEDVFLRLRRPPRRDAKAARVIRLGDNVVAALHVALLVVFALVWLRLPA